MTHGQEDLRGLLRRAAETQNPNEQSVIMVELTRRTDRLTFEAARALTGSGDPGERELGLAILGQLGFPEGRPFLEESLPVVLACCADAEQEVVSSAITALGHLGDPRGLAATLAHVAHPCEDVRFSVAFALPSVAGDPPAGEAVAALIRLTRDPDPEIRDWATFGLGSRLEADTAEIRDTLAERLADEGDTAGEALLGLARRKDPRALAPLLARLEREPGNLIVEAAGALAAPEALSALQRLRDAGWRDHGGTSTLDEAIEACSSGREATSAMPGAGTLQRTQVCPRRDVTENSGMPRAARYREIVCRAKIESTQPAPGQVIEHFG